MSKILTTQKLMPQNWKRPLIFALATIILIAALVTSYITLTKPTTPTPTAAPTLQVNTPTDASPINIGLIVSYTEDHSEGSGWDRAAEGAQVAAWRANQNGEKIKLHIVSDKGSDKGAQDAINELKKNDIKAAISASSGKHTQALADAAHAQGIPIIFLYEAPENLQTGKSWSFTANKTEINNLITTELHNRKLTNPLILHPAGTTPTISPTPTTYTPGNAEKLELTTITNPAYDAIIIEGNAHDTATLVAHIRSHEIDTPILTGTSTQNPHFYDIIQKTGTPTGDLTAVGEISADILALSTKTDGAQAGNFLHAVEIMSADTKTFTLDGSQPFRNVAAYADIRSHDAVLAIAAATNNTDIAAGLATLTQPIPGTISTNLDFSKPHITTAPLHTVVQATTTPTRLPLAWFNTQETQK